MMQFGTNPKKLYYCRVADLRVYLSIMHVAIVFSAFDMIRLFMRNAEGLSYLSIIAVNFLVLGIIVMLTALWYRKWPPRGGSITLEEDAISIVDQRRPTHINFGDISSFTVKQHPLFRANHIRIKRTDERWPFNTYRIEDCYEIGIHKLADQISVQMKSKFD